MTWRAACAAAVTAAIAAPALLAQAPIVNAVVERRAASGDLARDIQTVADRGATAWIGYRVPLAKRRLPDSFGGAGGRCRLEPPVDLLMLIRVEARAVSAVRPVAVDCDIDAGGMPLVWLEGVDPDASVRWLNARLRATPAPPQRVLTAALSALAQHGAPSAVPALMDIARAHPDRELRRQAMIRLGRTDDARALDFFAQILLK